MRVPEPWRGSSHVRRKHKYKDFVHTWEINISTDTIRRCSALAVTKTVEKRCQYEQQCILLVSLSWPNFPCVCASILLVHTYDITTQHPAQEQAQECGKSSFLLCMHLFVYHTISNLLCLALVLNIWEFFRSASVFAQHIWWFCRFG